VKAWEKYQSLDELYDEAAEKLVDEFAGIFGPASIRRFVKESFGYLESFSAQSSLPELTYRFAKERLEASAQAEGLAEKTVPEVLFVCVQNAGRSQMAAALLARQSQGRVHSRSAGSRPSDRIHEEVLMAMQELGIDLSEEYPKPLTPEVIKAADVVVTMGCGDECPVFPGRTYLDWDLPDPSGQPLAKVRAVRDEISRRVDALIDELTPIKG
jgi:arsenate reductase